jgi:outer membrane protein assembly factor BamA
MVKKCLIWAMMLSIVFGSCSIRRHLPKGTYLYNGASVTIKKSADNKGKTGSVKKSLTKIASPQKNKMILGYPYKLGFWYAIGETKRQKGFKFWLRNQLGEPPVLNTMVDLKANSDNMNAYIENKGYFKSTVIASSKIQGYKMKALYDILLTRPYVIDTVRWVLDSSILSSDILADKSKTVYIKTNQQFDLENIKAESKRIDIMLKTKGYYYFSPSYVKAYVDTGIGDHKINLFLSIKKETPLVARLPQTIHSITLFPNYTLLNPPPDTSKQGLLMYDGVFIRDTIHNFKPATLVHMLTYRPGSLYNVEKHNKSLNRFINLGAFKFVKSRYEPSSDSVSPSLMDVYYYLTALKKKTVTAEIGGFSKSNSFTGAQVNLNWKNRNLFKGAEHFNVKTYGAFEVSTKDSLKKNNNWRLGAEITLKVPGFVTPFRLKETGYFLPYTKFTLGYEWMRRQRLYTKNFFRLQYDLNWKPTSNKEHTITPLGITYNNATSFSEAYLIKVNQYAVLQYANKPEIIIGSFYNYTYHSINPSAKNILFFNGNLDVAGSIAGLINKPDSAFSKKIAGAYFAQFAKLDVDFRYSLKVAPNSYWVSRLAVGIGFPYGNSAYLPFSRQFIIGGSNSLRGFPPRQLGPGRVITTADQQASYPQIGGDYKLEMQSEWRFPLISKLKGALFAEAGNIWTKNELLYGKEAMLTNQFLKDLAVDAGVGIRLDISVLIIRLDVAVPLRKPWLPYGSEWVIKEINYGSSEWRKHNIIFNIGIGYPF